MWGRCRGEARRTEKTQAWLGFSCAAGAVAQSSTHHCHAQPHVAGMCRNPSPLLPVGPAFTSSLGLQGMICLLSAPRGLAALIMLLRVPASGLRLLSVIQLLWQV